LVFPPPRAIPHPRPVDTWSRETNLVISSSSSFVSYGASDTAVLLPSSSPRSPFFVTSSFSLVNTKKTSYVTARSCRVVLHHTPRFCPICVFAFASPPLFFFGIARILLLLEPGTRNRLTFWRGAFDEFFGPPSLKLSDWTFGFPFSPSPDPFLWSCFPSLTL